MMGCTTPVATIDWASSASLASSNWVRVWKGLRSMQSNGISRGLPVGSAAGADGGVGAGRCGRRDSRPLPRARRLGSAVAVGIVCGFLWRFIFQVRVETRVLPDGPTARGAATPWLFDLFG